MKTGKGTKKRKNGQRNVVEKAARVLETQRADKYLGSFGLGKQALATLNSPTKRIVAGVIDDELRQLDRQAIECGHLTVRDRGRIRRAVVETVAEAAQEMAKTIEGGRSSTRFAYELRSIYCPLTEADRICRAIYAVINAARRRR